MRLREAVRQGGLVVLLLLSACVPPSRPVRDTRADDVKTDSAEELGARLDALGDRKDPEAWAQRARIFARLRELKGAGRADLLALGDAADVAVLSGPGTPELKAESSDRLADHFGERAENPDLAALKLECEVADVLRRHAMFAVAARFREYSTPRDQASTLRLAAASARALSQVDSIAAEVRKRFAARAEALEARAEGKPANGGASQETRKFCELPLARHLEEAGRAADAGTREKAARGDAEKVVDWYLRALEHYALVSECMVAPGAADQRALSNVEIVARSLTDLLCGTVR